MAENKLVKPDLRKILSIMEWIEMNDELLKDDDLEEKFGRHSRILFERYCAGGTVQYAIVNQSGVWKLTQEGIRQLYRIKQIIAEQDHTVAEQRRAEWMKWATIAIALFAAVQAIVGVISIL